MTFNQWAELTMFTIVFVTLMFMLISEIKTNRAMEKWFTRLEKEYKENEKQRDNI